MSEQAAEGRPNRWVLQLICAGLAVMVLSGVVFYYTSRGVLLGRGSVGGVVRVVDDPSRNLVSLDHGLSLFAVNCAACHGATGRGDGAQAATMTPRPRDFSSGWFKVGSTRSGLPTDGDIAGTIRHGMLPAMMPPWAHLTDGEVNSLVLAVRHLAVEGRVADKLRRDPAFGRERAVELARAALDSGPVIALPPRPARVDLERGKVFYANNCAACHDPDGRARLREDLVDNDENPIMARDLTSGVFKGRNGEDDVAMRIVRGIPGSPMPGNPAIAAEDLWSVVAYVKGLAKGGDKPSTVAAGQREP